MHSFNSLLSYGIDPRVEAFSTEQGASLPYHVIQPHQTHTDNIAIITDRETSRDSLQDVDALITNLTDCAIGVRTADCVPVLLFATKTNVVAAIHSGWKGTVKRISQQTISLMQQSFGCKAEEIKAVIGPSICLESFQVGEEVVEKFSKAGFPMQRIHTIFPTSDKLPGHHIDLWQANKWLLEDVGVKEENIQIAGICTFINHNRFYSARHDGNNKSHRIINSIKII